MYESTTSVVGHLTKDPQLTMTPDGTPVVTLRVASTPRYWDRHTGGWKDAPSLFLDVTCWRTMARNAAETLQRGDRVIVVGRLAQRIWENDGQRHEVTRIEAEAVGPDLTLRCARIERPGARPRSGGDEVVGYLGAGTAEVITERGPVPVGADSAAGWRGADEPVDLPEVTELGMAAGVAPGPDTLD